MSELHIKIEPIFMLQAIMFVDKRAIIEAPDYFAGATVSVKLGWYLDDLSTNALFTQWGWRDLNPRPLVPQSRIRGSSKFIRVQLLQKLGHLDSHELT